MSTNSNQRPSPFCRPGKGKTGAAEVGAASITVFGVEVRAGDRVLLCLKGKVAIVEAIETDLDDKIHVAVVLEDDHGRDLGMMRQPGHRFFFSPEEIEPVRLNGEVAHERSAASQPTMSILPTSPPRSLTSCSTATCVTGTQSCSVYYAFFEANRERTTCSNL